jgi:leucyl-tRNA synthetase
MELPVGVENMIAQGAAKEITNVAEFISGKEIRKVIFVPDKLVNFVVA